MADKGSYGKWTSGDLYPSTEATGGGLDAAAIAKLAGAGALGAGLTALPAIIGRLSPEGRAMAKQRKEDLKKLRKGELGFSEAQKRQLSSAAAQSLQAKTKADVAGIQREAAAAGRFGRSGAYMRSLGDIYKGGQAELAKTRGQIEDASTKFAQQEKERILQAVQERRDKIAETVGGAVLGGATAAKAAWKKEKAATAAELAGAFPETDSSLAASTTSSPAPVLDAVTGTTFDLEGQNYIHRNGEYFRTSDDGTETRVDEVSDPDLYNQLVAAYEARQGGE